MASEKLQRAYDAAKKNPMKIGISVHTHFPAVDSKWEKEQKQRRKDELARLTKEIDKFDREKAADRVLSALMREKERVERQLEDDNDYYGAAL